MTHLYLLRPKTQEKGHYIPKGRIVIYSYCILVNTRITTLSSVAVNSYCIWHGLDSLQHLCTLTVMEKTAFKGEYTLEGKKHPLASGKFNLLNLLVPN